MVIDSHTHAWGPSTDEHPWVNERLIRTTIELPTPAPYTAEHLLADMDEAGVDNAVVIGLGIPDWRDNWYLFEAIKSERLAGIGLVDPFGGDVEDRIERLMAAAGIFGVRLGPIFPKEEMWAGEMDSDERWLPDVLDSDAFWAAVERTGAVVQFLIHTSQLEQVLAVVEQHPDVSYLIDHFARVDPGVDTEKSGFETFADLAEYDVTVKVSAAPTLSNEPFPYCNLHESLLELFEWYGRERLVWGSDQPMVSKWGTYEESIAWLDNVEELSSADRTWLTGRSFSRRFDPF